jgi:hypothetical protein
LTFNKKFKIFAISGSGSGAGKTHASRVLAQDTWTIADGMRRTLQERFPYYNWFNREQAYKNETIIREYGRGKHTMRQVLLEYGQEMCAGDPEYWIRLLGDSLERSSKIADGIGVIGIDDVRKVCEVNHLKARFPNVTHLHLNTAHAVHEPEFEARSLLDMADYVLTWE